MNILTITLNPSIDHILTIDRIDLREKNILASSQTFYGGKGVNVAFVLGKLGVDTTASGLVGEDEAANFSHKLAKVGINPAFVLFDGKTRQTYKVMESSSGKDTEFNQPGEPVPAAAVDTFMVELGTHLHANDWVVMCGSVPAGVSADIYARIITMCREKEAKTMLDTSGAPLVNGAKAIPTFLKINLSELNELKPAAGPEIENILPALKDLHRDGISFIVISLGAEGALGYDGKNTWKVVIPPVKIKGLTGAGDAMTGGLLAAFDRGKPFPESLRFAGALATASTQKFEPGDFNAEELNRILAETRVEKLSD